MTTVPDFNRVRRVSKSCWFKPHYLRSAIPGDLLLVGEYFEKPGGFLRLRKASVFLSLTAEQVWGGEAVLWPRAVDGIASFTISEDGSVLFVPKDIE